MSRSSPRKKLQPVSKALKRFTYNLQSRLSNFDFSKAAKVIKTSAISLLSYCPRHLFLLFKKRFITKRPSYGHFYQSYSYNNNKNQLLHKNFSAIYIDHLYAAEPATGSGCQVKHFHAHAETSRSGKQVFSDEKVVARTEGKAKGKVLYSVEDAWREVVARSPQLRPVDERAEEFISNFRQDMKLQKEKSLLEYQEMLARSA